MSDATSFMYLPKITIEESDVMILPLPYTEVPSFKSGTEDGPRSIINCSHNLEYYDEDLKWDPFKRVHVALLEPFICESGPQHITKITDYIESLPLEKLLITLGGEHNITGPILNARCRKPATVVWIDAHLDLRESYLGSPTNHACAARHVVEAGHRLIMVGIRSVYEEDMAYVEQHQDQISVYLDQDLHRSAQYWDDLYNELSSIQGDVYLSVDMDGFDPAVVPGVANPTPGGLTWYQALFLIRHLFTVIHQNKLQLRGVDFVELVPDPTSRSEMVVCRLLIDIISKFAWHKEKS